MTPRRYDPAYVRSLLKALPRYKLLLFLAYLYWRCLCERLTPARSPLPLADAAELGAIWQRLTLPERRALLLFFRYLHRRPWLAALAGAICAGWIAGLLPGPALILAGLLAALCAWPRLAWALLLTWQAGARG